MITVTVIRLVHSFANITHTPIMGMHVEILNRADYFGCDKAISILPRFPQPEFPEHGHEFHELVLVKSGTGIHFIDGRPCLAGKGSVFYLRAGQAHFFDRADALCLTNVVFAPELLQTALLLNFLPASGGEASIRIDSDTQHDCERLFSAISAECGKTDEGSAPMLESLFAQLVVMLWRNSHHIQRQANGDDKLLALILYLDHHFSEEIDFGALSEQFSIPLRTMTRRILDATGLTPNHYVGRLRLCRAMRLLRQSDASITDIAFSCGFNDSNYFSSRFHHETGITPRQFRMRQLNDLDRDAKTVSFLAVDTR